MRAFRRGGSPRRWLINRSGQGEEEEEEEEAEMGELIEELLEGLEDGD